MTPTATADVSVEAIARAYELVDRLNGVIDLQTADQKREDGYDAPADAEYHVMITARDERELNEAALCLKKTLDTLDRANSALPDTTSQNNAEKLPNREAAAGLPGREDASVIVVEVNNILHQLDGYVRQHNRGAYGYFDNDKEARKIIWETIPEARKKLNTLLSLLSAPGGTWQAIESAPRDGKNVVLYHKIHGEMEGHFESCREWEHHELGKQYDGALWILGDDIYQEAVEEGPSGEFFDGQITHWRLPSPPSTGKGSGQCP